MTNTDRARELADNLPMPVPTPDLALKLIIEALDEATLKERERCAMVVEEHGWDEEPELMRENLAAAIRKGPDNAEKNS